MSALGKRALLATVGLALGLSGCGSGTSAAECRAAATAQATAESVWSAALDAHASAHEDGRAHPDEDDAVLVNRIELIIAVESTRRACQLPSRLRVSTNFSVGVGRCVCFGGHGFGYRIGC